MNAELVCKIYQRKLFQKKHTHAGSIANTILPACLIQKQMHLAARKAKISTKKHRSKGDF